MKILYSVYVTATVPTRVRIRRIALRLLEKGGPEAVTMRRIARLIDITPMAIYHHFETREALLQDIVDTEFDAFLEVTSKTPVHGTVEDQVTRVMDAYIEYGLSKPQIFDYVFSKPREGARRFPDDFRARRSPTLNPLADSVAKWMEEGIVERDDVWEVALELWAHAHGYIALYRAGRFSLPPAEFKELVHRSMRRLLHGLKAQHISLSQQASTGSGR